MDIKPLHLAEATLSITVSPAADGKVLIEFSTPLNAIELSAEDAQDFALTILDQVEATKKPPESLN
jgi:hypothetical protein